VQLGKEPGTEILANFETTAKEFLYPFPNSKFAYHIAERNLFMARTIEFPVIEVLDVKMKVEFFFSFTNEHFFRVRSHHNLNFVRQQESKNLTRQQSTWSKNMKNDFNLIR
jgi:hypothetical protein